MNPGRISDLPIGAVPCVDPLGKRHATILPNRQIACQARFSSQRMEAADGKRNNSPMPAPKKTAAAQPTLRAWRSYKKLTLEDVAAKIGVGPQAIHKWETGKVPITLDNLRLLAEAYGIKVGSLLLNPEESELAERLHRAQNVLLSLPAEKVERWLGMGEDLAEMIDPDKNRPLGKIPID